MQTITSLKIRFFHLLSLNETNYILALKKLRVCRFSRLTSLSSYSHLQTLSTIVIILKNLNLLLDSHLSHLREHKFKHSFQDTINPLCSCGIDMESTEHFLLYCPQFVNERHTLLSTIGNINYKLLENTNSNLTQALLFGNTSFDINDNNKVLNATINFILLAKRFDEPLF